MTHRLGLFLFWLFAGAAIALACAAALMLINGVPDAAGGAGIVALLAVCVGSVGAILRYVAGRPA